MSVSSSHYSKAFDPERMNSWANQYAELIVNSAKGKEIVLIYSGMSGVNHAAYITSAIYTKYEVKCSQIYVRKSNEKSHGRSIETTSCLHCLTDYFLVFVDDFVSSGTSLLYCIRRIIENEELELTDTNELFVCVEAEECYGSQFFRRHKDLASSDPVIVTIKDLVMFTKLSLRHSTFYTSQKEYRAWSKYRKMFKISHVNS